MLLLQCRLLPRGTKKRQQQNEPNYCCQCAEWWIAHCYSLIRVHLRSFAVTNDANFRTPVAALDQSPALRFLHKFFATKQIEVQRCDFFVSSWHIF